MADISDFGGFKLLYQHAAASDDEYIARNSDGSIHRVRLYEGVVSSLQRLCRTGSVPQIVGFGNALIIVGDQEYTFIWRDKEYLPFALPEPSRITVSDYHKTAIGSDFYLKRDLRDEIFIPSSDFHKIADYPPAVAEDNAFYGTLLADVRNETVLVEQQQNGAWHGELLCVCTYRMTDGTLVAPSAMLLITPEEYNQQEVENGGNKTGIEMNALRGDATSLYVFLKNRTATGIETNNYHIQPDILLDIPVNLDERMIDSVVVYCTRLNPLWDFGQIWKRDGSWQAPRRAVIRNFYAAGNDLFTQPLYRLKEIPLRDFTDGKYTFSLTYSLLDGIETAPVYEPTQSLHSFYAGVYYEYNGRLHRANLSTKLFPGYPDVCAKRIQAGSTETALITTIEVEGTLYNIALHIPGAVPLSTSRVVSYPDYRAKRFAVVVGSLSASVGGDKTFSGTSYCSLPMEPCEANNYAYAVQPQQDNVKYPTLPLSAASGQLSVTLTERISQPNRIQVSGTNNPFSQPFALSYRIGSAGEHIIALCSVADELSESRFGAFPLFAFTDAGIWSLESGTGEILYGSAVPVNHDRITNPTVQSARNSVFYITAQGLHAIQGRYSKLVSDSLTASGNPAALVDYLADAGIHYQFRYDDLVLYNPAYSYAYVYDITQAVWSSRDLLGRILNSLQVIPDRVGIIRTLDDEEVNGTIECQLRTRPIKLGSTDYKRLVTVVARIEAVDCMVSIAVEGSDDCIRWVRLKEGFRNLHGMDVSLHRFPVSCRFYRFILHISTCNSASLSGIDVEYFERFKGRLR